MRLFELTIEDFEDEVFAISLVHNPAIEALGQYFNRDEVHFAEMKEEGLFMAPILIPNKRILRVDGSGVPYEVFFTPETIKRLSQLYLEKKYQDKVTEEHDMNVKGVTLVETWIKESVERDKSKLYGLNVPAGSWIGTFKIDNPELREKFKSGDLRAVSIEGMFTHLEKTPKDRLDDALLMESFADFIDKNVNELTEVEATQFLSKIKALIKRDNRMKSGKKVEMESYSDYGDGVQNNAKRAVEWAEKNGWGSCGTPVGKTRASQLAKGEPISVETIKRMHSYLSRHEDDLESSKSFGEGCGYLMYQSWGGKAGLSWSRNKLRELGEIDLAEVGPRGGIKESPKAPKSDTKNPDPKGEGTAKGDASGKRGAKVTQEQEKTLQGKVDDFNEKDSNTKNGRATLGALKSVFQRGLGAYNTSRSPAVRSAEQWAYARVNAFLYLLKNGRPENAKYTTDYDLLPKDHPKYTEKMEAQPSVTSTYPGEPASGSIAPALFVEAPEMDIYGYETEYFYMCPGAVGTFNHLVNEMEIVEDDLVDMIRAAAVFADMVFDIEANVIEDGKAEAEDLKRASILVDMFKDVFQTVNERTGMEHDISYMDGHIDVIKGYL